jgi:cyclophilin family peptidyl-prolyl cis-trans isomerase
MKQLLFAAAALIAVQPLAQPSPALGQASAAQAAGKTKPSPLAPSEIVAAAPKGDWVAIPDTDLLVMDLAPDAKGRPRRVVIQLMPAPFSQGWIGNIRLLAKAHWWDGLSINRVQDNYVVQWGDAEGEDPAKARALPEGLAVVPKAEYTLLRLSVDMHMSDGSSITDWFPYFDAVRSGTVRRRSRIEGYPYATGFLRGWPFAGDVQGTAQTEDATYWPVHCYGMVGVGRDLSPNTGSGAELYVVIGHAPRHLDRNIALVGRVIEGIEHLSSLPRGHGPLGFYDLAQGDERVPIRAIRLQSEIETDKPLPQYEYLSTESDSFARYADARANRRDPFFIRPAGGADICNIPVPVRRVT